MEIHVGPEQVAESVRVLRLRLEGVPQQDQGPLLQLFLLNIERNRGGLCVQVVALPAHELEVTLFLLAPEIIVVDDRVGDQDGCLLRAGQEQLSHLFPLLRLVLDIEQDLDLHEEHVGELGLPVDVVLLEEELVDEARHLRVLLLPEVEHCQVEHELRLHLRHQEVAQQLLLLLLLLPFVDVGEEMAELLVDTVGNSFKADSLRPDQRTLEGGDGCHLVVGHSLLLLHFALELLPPLLVVVIDALRKSLEGFVGVIAHFQLRAHPDSENLAKPHQFLSLSLVDFHVSQ